MRTVFSIILYPIIWILSHIYTYKTSFTIKRVCNFIYTLWIKNFIGEIGGNSIIYYPCSLQGGGAKRIHIGSNTYIQNQCILGCWEHYNAYDGQRKFTPEIIIGSNCSIGEYNHITACNKIVIGDGLLTGRYVYIGDNSHGGMSIDELNIPPAARTLLSKGEIIIGKNVWIGDKVTILANVKIGDGAIIGANSVVTHDVPEYSVVAGVPARIVKIFNRN